MTRLLGVVGDPIGHSLSPLIHNAWLHADQVDAVYSAFHVPSGQFEAGLGTLSDQGLIGLNVTLPHKQEALRLADSRSSLAQTLGAANLLIRQGNSWYADNTDAPGFAMTLEQTEFSSGNPNVFLLGAGGSARAVACVLHQLGMRLTICNRTVSKARDLAAHLAPGSVVLSLEDGLGQSGEADLIVNTLSLGQTGGEFALPSTRSGIFYDISYGKGAQKALSEARRKGWRTKDGLSMLIAQAALSYKAWFGKMPDMHSAYALCRNRINEDS